jgi:molybdenum cofactor guanylyltransferase
MTSTQARPRKDRSAIILAGGQSRRMGLDKASLPFGGETMLERVVRVCQAACNKVVIVGGQQPPELPNVAHALDDGRGPLDGILAGLRRITPGGFAFATGCDSPLLQPGLIDLLFEKAASQRGVVPAANGHLHPTCAVYSPSLVPDIEALLQAGERRAVAITRLPGVMLVEEPDLRVADPELLSLRGCNTPEEYASLLQLAGLSADSEPRAADERGSRRA